MAAGTRYPSTEVQRIKFGDLTADAIPISFEYDGGSQENIAVIGHDGKELSFPGLCDPGKVTVTYQLSGPPVVEPDVYQSQGLVGDAGLPSPPGWVPEITPDVLDSEPQRVTRGGSDFGRVRDEWQDRHAYRPISIPWSALARYAYGGIAVGLLGLLARAMS